MHTEFWKIPRGGPIKNPRLIEPRLKIPPLAEAPTRSAGGFHEQTPVR